MTLATIRPVPSRHSRFAAAAIALVVALGFAASAVAPASADPVQGVTWSAGGTLPTGSWKAIGYGGARFLAVADDGTVVTSTDNGTSWTPVGMVPAAPHTSNVAYGEPQGVPTWVLTQKAPKRILTSIDDGASWTEHYLDYEPLKVAYLDGHFMVAVYYTNQVWVSSDGIDWSGGIAYFSRNSNHFGQFIYGNHTIVDPNPYTRDVTTWDTSLWATTGSVSATFNMDVLVSNSGCSFYVAGAYGNGIYAGAVDACNGTPYIQVSTDKGATWTADGLDLSSPVAGVAFGDGIFVATLTNRQSAFSPDALLWTGAGASGAGSSGLIAFGDHHFVAINDRTTAIGVATNQTSVSDAPTNAAAVAEAGAATVSWDAPASDGGDLIDGYTVTGSPSGSCVSTGATTCEVTGLTGGTSYTFTVTAHNSNGDSVASEASAAVTPIDVPGAPTGVAGASGDGSVTVSWTAPTDDGGDAVNSYTVTGLPGGTCTTSTTSCEVSGLTNGTSYTFTVTAHNTAGDSIASSASESLTPMTFPDVPTWGMPQVGDATVTLMWVPPANDGGSAITRYTVTGSPSGSCETSAQSVSLTSCVITELTNGEAYTFTVVAWNTNGDSDSSLILGPLTPSTTPNAPTGVSADPIDSSVTVSWAAPEDDGGATVTSYVVTGAPGGTCETSQTSCVISELTNGASYTFTVIAHNFRGDSAASSASDAVVPGAVSGAPRNVTAVASDKATSVSWLAPASTGGLLITQYKVTSLPGGFTCITTGGLSCVVDGLTNGQSYTFRVVASNLAGDSAASNPSASATPIAEVNRITIVKAVSRSLTGAPLVTIQSGDKVAFIVNGVPKNSVLAVSRLRVPAARAANPYVSLGSVTSSKFGKVKLPDLTLKAIGVYTLKITTAGGVTYYLKVAVVRG